MKKLTHLILLFASLFLFSNNNALSADEAAFSEEALKILEPKDSDIVYGNKDAKAVIVEYASLSCAHCAGFHADILPFLEEKFIKDGKLKVIFRHFPLNAQAMKASLLVECLDSNERKQKFLKTLFKSIDKWAYHTDFQDKLGLIAKIGGVGPDEFKKCMGNKALEDKILASRLDAANKVKVQSTPTIILNNKKIQFQTKEDLAAMIEEVL